MLRKGIYSYEYMFNWQKFNETALPEREELYSNLSMEDNTNADCMHVKRVCKAVKKELEEEYVTQYCHHILNTGM